MGMPSTQTETIQLEHLVACESFWRDRYVWLLESGYELPPHFKPGSPPIIASKTDLKSEDEYVVNMKVWARTGSADVIQAATGDVVSLYQVSKGDCLRMLDAYSSWHLPPGTPTTFEERPIRSPIDDARNRCHPIIAAPKQDVYNPQLVFLVTPTSRSLSMVEYTTIGEALQCFRQMLQHHIASGDEGLFDVQMDLTTFLPCEEVPSGLSFRPALSLPAWQALADDKLILSRSKDARYYFNIPRGLRQSVHHTRAGSKQPAGEQSDQIYCIKAALDVMHLGRMLHRDFIKRFEALSFLRHLANRMMEDDLVEVIASKTEVVWQVVMDEVVEKFDAIVSQLPEQELQEPLGMLFPSAVDG